MQREKPPEWREKQKGSRGIRRGQRYRLVFQFPIRERTMKTRARYISIINSHLTARDKGNWHYALYVMPDTKSKESLIRLFDSIKTVMRNNTLVPFDAKNREMFIFRTIDELEQ